MPKVGNGFLGRAKLKVIHPHNDIETRQVWPFTEGMGQITRCCTVVEQALVSEAQVDLRFDKAWIQGKHFLEGFGGAAKIAPSESGLSRAKRCFKILL